MLLAVPARSQEEKNNSERKRIWIHKYILYEYYQIYHPGSSQPISNQLHNAMADSKACSQNILIKASPGKKKKTHIETTNVTNSEPKHIEGCKSVFLQTTLSSYKQHWVRTKQKIKSLTLNPKIKSLKVAGVAKRVPKDKNFGVQNKKLTFSTPTRVNIAKF